MYSKLGGMVLATRVFDSMVDKNLVCLNSFIDGYPRISVEGV